MLVVQLDHQHRGQRLAIRQLEIDKHPAALLAVLPPHAVGHAHHLHESDVQAHDQAGGTAGGRESSMSAVAAPEEASHRERQGRQGDRRAAHPVRHDGEHLTAEAAGRGTYRADARGDRTGLAEAHAALATASRKVGT